jgi:Carboxylesterase family
MVCTLISYDVRLNYYFLGLVHGAIMMSGSTLTGLSYDKNPVKSARDIASFANCGGTDEQVSLCLFYAEPSYVIDAHIEYYVRCWLLQSVFKI